MKTETILMIGAALSAVAIGAVVMRKPARRTSGGGGGGTVPGGSVPGGEQTGLGGLSPPTTPIDDSNAAMEEMRIKLCRRPGALNFNDQNLILDRLVRPVWAKLFDPSAPGDVQALTSQVATIVAMRCPPNARLSATLAIQQIIYQAVSGGRL